MSVARLCSLETTHSRLAYERGIAKDRTAPQSREEGGGRQLGEI